jgi:MFS family permease
MRRLQPAYVAAAERHVPRNFVLFALDATAFSFALALFSEATILPAFVGTLTDAPLAFGLLATVFALGRFLPQLVGTWLVGGRERRKGMVVAIAAAQRLGMLLIALTAMTAGVLPDGQVLVLFFLAFAFYATTSGLIGPPFGDLLAKAIVRRRGRLYGVSQLLGGIAGISAAAIAAELLRTLPSPQGLQASFWLAFAASSISLVFLALIREVPYPVVAPREPLRRLVGGIPALLRANHAYRWFLGSRSVVALGSMGVGFVVAASLARGVTPSEAGAFLLVYLAAQSAAGLAWGMLADRFGWKLVLQAGAACLATGMLIAMGADGLLGFAAAFALLGMANAANMASDPNLTFELAPPDDTARYLGVTMTVIAPALAIGPLVAGVIAGLASYTALFALSALLAIAGLVTATLRFQEPRART